MSCCRLSASLKFRENLRMLDPSQYDFGMTRDEAENFVFRGDSIKLFGRLNFSKTTQRPSLSPSYSLSFYFLWQSDFSPPTPVRTIFHSEGRVDMLSWPGSALISE